MYPIVANLYGESFDFSNRPTIRVSSEVYGLSDGSCSEPKMGLITRLSDGSGPTRLFIGMLGERLDGPRL